MLLVARRAALAAAATGRGAVWSRPVAVTVKCWLAASPLPMGGAAAVAERRSAASAAFSSAAASEFRWSRVILPALEAFAQVHGHCLVPHGFVVPPTSPWPTDAWGVKLGSCVNSIRSRGSFSSQIRRDAARLVAIDFVWDVSEYKWTERILPALTAFATKFGHCDVPRSFIVPSEPEWPKKAWQFKLGICVQTIRVHDAFSEQTERDAAQLEAIGFIWGSRDHQWSTLILPALEAFAAKHGHCNVPQAFVVPSKAPWPREAWGVKLGMYVSCIRSKGSYATQAERDAARLEAIDFVWRWDEYQWTRRILPSLEVFHRVEGHSNVPSGFVVPSESPWPESAWGLKLGKVIVAIRRRITYSKFVDRDAGRLMELGFPVKPKGPHTGK